MLFNANSSHSAGSAIGVMAGRKCALMLAITPLITVSLSVGAAAVEPAVSSGRVVKSAEQP